MSKNLLTVVHVVIHNSGSLKHTQKLEILHSKLQNLSEKYENIKSTFSIKQI